METIIFTGGASRGTETVIPLDVDRLKCQLFGCKNREERSPGPSLPNYSEKVLVGNWFERRSVYHRPTDEWITVYKTHYKPHGVKNSIEDVFTVWKNKQKTQGADRQPIMDGNAYLDNMTTVYDLGYRILSKNLCGPRIRVYNARKNVWVPEADLTPSYGNQTNYGLADSVKRKQADYIRAEGVSPWKSIYKVDYNEPVVTSEDQKIKRFPRLRGDTNTPDLRHLGITTLSSSKSPARESQHRSSRCEKICTWL